MLKKPRYNGIIFTCKEGCFSKVGWCPVDDARLAFPTDFAIDHLREAESPVAEPAVMVIQDLKFQNCAPKISWSYSLWWTKYVRFLNTYFAQTNEFFN